MEVLVIGEDEHHVRLAFDLAQRDLINECMAAIDQEAQKQREPELWDHVSVEMELIFVKVMAQVVMFRMP